MKLSTSVVAFFFFLVCSAAAGMCAEQAELKSDGDFVVLLHGMKRSAGSMNKIEIRLLVLGYRTLNIDYPSSQFTIEELSEFIHKEITRRYSDPARPLHVVTHSMGGILTRYYLTQHRPQRLGRVVMLAPPNQGTEMSDFLQGTGVFEAIFGPAGTQLGTNEKSITRALGPVDYELGVIMGNISLNPVASIVVPGDDDGLVSHERSKVAGMKDSVIIPAAHSFIMYSDKAVEHTVHFLKHGNFKKEED